MASLQGLRLTCCGCADLRTGSAFINCIILFTTLFSVQAIPFLAQFNFFMLNNIIIFTSLLGLWAVYTNEARWAIPFTALFTGVMVARFGFLISGMLQISYQRPQSIARCITDNPDLVDMCATSSAYRFRLLTVFVVCFILIGSYFIYIECMYAYALYKSPSLLMQYRTESHIMYPPAPVYEVNEQFDPVPAYTPPYVLPKTNDEVEQVESSATPAAINTSHCPTPPEAVVVSPSLLMVPMPAAIYPMESIPPVAPNEASPLYDVSVSSHSLHRPPPPALSLDAPPYPRGSTAISPTLPTLRQP
ncbi:hypothetical protein BASA50_007648 [Batrachochytrium salamandrivorans]|uniref:Uncharacterized protein n=1 Tax=Batrachochytrium salamandrivorans TaxID=1357716 RepID=A0ABQ8F9L8_9FUNG|nr:hypothetical protein BASA60_010091 [Batrachochytrium salamandrivorans]KAH6593066.1 hypothetical protein BASA50_007648 [Batrachochytrium salamandrivorans]KAH6598318.1 hypothetical protein BASA61_002904 [Batrachochytrium salamandrivorans]KAH9251235.1 hypothetical protein BASA81_010931 [Batrachochytrium salamandrivorans]